MSPETPTPEQPRSERKTQNRAIALFTDQAQPDCLGYRYLGEWNKRGSEKGCRPGPATLACIYGGERSL